MLHCRILSSAFHLLIAALFLTGIGSVQADAISDVQKLKSEALEILKANANRQATPAQYASCIYKLEQAQSLLDKAGDNDSALAQEVSSTLFWARRFSNLPVLAELDKLRGGARAPELKKKAEPATPARPKDADPDEAAAQAPALLEAKKAFQGAEQFARSHDSDDYAVALRWFQMANEHPGTEYSIKALQLARDAQKRFAAASTPIVEKIPDGPEMKLIKDGDELMKKGRFEQAVAMYQSSAKLKDNELAHQRLGNAYFERAQKMNDEVLPQIEAAQSKVYEAAKEAWMIVRTVAGPRRKFNPKYPPLVEAQRKLADVNAKTKNSLAQYDKAYDEFGLVLHLSPNERDLEAAAHRALCISARPDATVRTRARQLLNAVLTDYTPQTDIERSIYEFCKTELRRLNK